MYTEIKVGCGRERGLGGQSAFSSLDRSRATSLKEQEEVVKDLLWMLLINSGRRGDVQEMPERMPMRKIWQGLPGNPEMNVVLKTRPGIRSLSFRSRVSVCALGGRFIASSVKFSMC